MQPRHNHAMRGPGDNRAFNFDDSASVRTCENDTRGKDARAAGAAQRAADADESIGETVRPENSEAGTSCASGRGNYDDEEDDEWEMDPLGDVDAMSHADGREEGTMGAGEDSEESPEGTGNVNTPSGGSIGEATRASYAATIQNQAREIEELRIELAVFEQEHARVDDKGDKSDDDNLNSEAEDATGTEAKTGGTEANETVQGSGNDPQASMGG